MKYTLIILNLLAAAWMWFFSPAVQKLDHVHMYSQVRELEQAGVINTNLLTLFLKNKHEKSNDVPGFGLATYMHHWRHMHNLFITPATIAFLCNTCIIALFWKSKKKVQQPPERGSMPAAH